MLTSIAYLFLAGMSLGWVCRRLRLPGLVGMLLAGILLGPYALDLLHPSLLGVSVELRQVALVIILLRAGLALDVRDLRRAGRPAILLCFVPAGFELAGMLLIAPRLLGVSTLEAAIMGAVVAAVSPAVIVPRMLHLMEHRIGTRKSIPQMIMAGASVDDVFVIVLFTSFTTLATGGEVSAASFAQIPLSIVTGLALGVAAGAAAVWFFKRFHLRDSVKVIALLSMSFLFLAAETALKDTVAVSGLLAVMAMGVTLLMRYPVLAGRLSAKFSKLWVAAEVVLFVLVGATVDIRFAASAGLAAIGVLAGVLVFRMAGVSVCMLGTQLDRRERLFCMIAYLPKATVQAAIGSLPLAMGMPCGPIVLTVAVLAILITAPLGAFGIDMTYKRLLEPEAGPADDARLQG